MIWFVFFRMKNSNFKQYEYVEHLFMNFKCIQLRTMVNMRVNTKFIYFLFQHFCIICEQWTLVTQRYKSFICNWSSILNSSSIFMISFPLKRSSLSISNVKMLNDIDYRLRSFFSFVFQHENRYGESFCNLQKFYFYLIFPCTVAFRYPSAGYFIDKIYFHGLFYCISFAANLCFYRRSYVMLSQNNIVTNVLSD